MPPPGADRVKGILKKEGLKNVTGDEAFYFCHEDRKLVGMILTHVNDLDIESTKEFVDRIRKILIYELKVSKVKKDRLNSLGLMLRKLRM
jgi:hypothetical protein